MNHLITCCGCVCRNNCQMALFLFNLTQEMQCNAKTAKEIHF